MNNCFGREGTHKKLPKIENRATLHSVKTDNWAGDDFFSENIKQKINVFDVLLLQQPAKEVGQKRSILSLACRRVRH